MAEFMWQSKLNNSDPFETILKYVASFWESWKSKTFYKFFNIISLFYIYTMYFLLFHFLVLIFFNIISINKLNILYFYNVFVIMEGGKITNLSSGAITNQYRNIYTLTQ